MLDELVNVIFITQNRRKGGEHYTLPLFAVPCSMSLSEKPRLQGKWIETTVLVTHGVQPSGEAASGTGRVSAGFDFI